MRFFLTAACVLTASAPAIAAPMPVVAFYGSSTTVGVGASRPDRRFSSLLCRMMGWQEVNAGLSGATVANEDRGPVSVERWKREVLPSHPDRVVAMLGANDAARNLSVASFNTNLDAMIATLPKDFRLDHLALADCQPSQDTLAHRAAFDQALAATAKRTGALYVATEQAFPVAEIPAMRHDSIHMNDLGHAIVASFLANAMTAAGWGPAVPAAQGGSWPDHPALALPARSWLIADNAPLTAGALEGVDLGLSAAATVRVGVFRPGLHGGFDRLYRTAELGLPKGDAHLPLPRWRVLAGDRLAVWTSTAALRGTPLPGSGHPAAVVAVKSAGSEPADVPYWAARRTALAMPLRARLEAPPAVPVPVP